MILSIYSANQWIFGSLLSLFKYVVQKKYFIGYKPPQESFNLSFLFDHYYKKNIDFCKQGKSK